MPGLLNDLPEFNLGIGFTPKVSGLVKVTHKELEIHSL